MAVDHIAVLIVFNGNLYAALGNVGFKCRIFISRQRRQ